MCVSILRPSHEKRRQGQLIVQIRSAIRHELSRRRPMMEGKCLSCCSVCVCLLCCVKHAVFHPFPIQKPTSVTVQLTGPLGISLTVRIYLFPNKFSYGNQFNSPSLPLPPPLPFLPPSTPKRVIVILLAAMVPEQKKNAKNISHKMQRG